MHHEWYSLNRIIRGVKTLRQKLFLMMALAIFAALLLAANEISRPDGWSIFSLYLYWVARIALEALLFAATFLLAIQVPYLGDRQEIAVLTATFFSYIPFVLTITALDIVIGLPELGWPPDSGQQTNSQLGAFFLELFYLLDNHLFLCLLISIPILFDRTGNIPEGLTSSGSSNASSIAGRQETSAPGRVPFSLEGSTEFKSPFFKSLSPAFRGFLLRAEAQEHYVRLVGSEDSRMVLYRFSDVLRELPDELGLQVHRSHWVAYDAVESVYRAGNNTRIKTVDGAEVPVSRRFSDTVQTLLADYIDSPSPR